MNCNNVQDIFSLILEDEASAVERAAFQDHLAGCSRCRDDFEVFRATSDLVRNLSPIEPSPGFEDRILSRIRAAGSSSLPPVPIEMPREGGFWSGWFPRVGLAAAAAAFIIFAFTSQKKSEDQAPSMAQGSGGVETLKERMPDLPDEVVDALNQDSYVLDKMVVRPGSGQGDVQVVAPVGYESGPVYVAF